MTRYFLDTTAHIERWAGDRCRKEHVRNALGGGAHATSLHALREWRHIIEGASVDVLNAIRERPTTLGDIFARLGQGWGRTPGHRWRVLALVSGAQKEIDLDLIELRARALIRYQSDEMFRTQIDTIRDGSQCGLAIDNLVRPNGKGGLVFTHPRTGSEWCKKTDNICRQDEDLGSKEPRLLDAASALLASSAHKATGQAAKLAAESPRERKGKQCFARLGDVSIALECVEGEVVLTTDSSFGVMAESLGLVVDTFSPTPTP